MSDVDRACGACGGAGACDACGGTGYTGAADAVERATLAAVAAAGGVSSLVAEIAKRDRRIATLERRLAKALRLAAHPPGSGMFRGRQDGAEDEHGAPLPRGRVWSRKRSP